MSYLQATCIGCMIGCTFGLLFFSGLTQFNVGVIFTCILIGGLDAAGTFDRD